MVDGIVYASANIEERNNLSLFFKLFISNPINTVQFFY